MNQLALTFPPTSPRYDDRTPTFIAEDNATLLAIAAQANRHPRGRCCALHVLRWRQATATTGGRTGRPTARQAAAIDALTEELGP